MNSWHINVYTNTNECRRNRKNNNNLWFFMSVDVFVYATSCLQYTIHFISFIELFLSRFSYFFRSLSYFFLHSILLFVLASKVTYIQLYKTPTHTYTYLHWKQCQGRKIYLELASRGD